MLLSWTVNGHNFEAFGHRGHYLIKRAPGYMGCILTATGHDALPMLALPPDGKPFNTVQLAKDYANKLDRTKTAEPQGGVG